MTHVTWQLPSQAATESFARGALENHANGGDAYAFQAMMALNTEYETTFDPASIRRKGESLLRYYWRLRKTPVTDDVVVLDAQVAALKSGRRKEPGAEIALIHHLDYRLRDSSLKYRWYFSRLFARLRNADRVVTVAEYWRRELERQGCSNVDVIYNSFDPADYDVTSEQLDAFRQRFGFAGRRPLIYIGNASREKGVLEAYEALKDRDCDMIMTGARKDVDIPVPFHTLDRADYVCLLNACDLVLTMSRLPEGWNRVAHEALLCGTPVIGSGIAGMGELLDGAGQLVAKSVKDLGAAVDVVLGRREEFASAGHQFVRQFDMAYFRSAWLSVIQQVTADS